MLSLEQQNRLREQYSQSNPGWRPATEVFADLVRDNLQPGVRLLDLGCGRGGLVEQLEAQTGQMIGIDPDVQSLREHRLAMLDPPLPRVAGFSEQLPFAAESFDLVFASWLLEHLRQPAMVFRQIGRVLRLGGVFVFITPNKRHPLSGLNRLAGRFAWLQGSAVRRLYGRAPEDTFPVSYRANTAAELGRLARFGEMRLVQLEAISDPTYLAFRPFLLRLAGRLESRLAADRGIHLVGYCRR
jgi:ubiquinone/menaquinone biosynthesis C-methylase UbiE